MMIVKQVRELYIEPMLMKHENIKELIFECSDWPCSVTVPPGFLESGNRRSLVCARRFISL